MSGRQQRVMVQPIVSVYHLHRVYANITPAERHLQKLATGLYDLSLLPDLTD